MTQRKEKTNARKMAKANNRHHTRGGINDCCQLMDDVGGETMIKLR